MAGRKTTKEKSTPWHKNYAQWFTNDFANTYVSGFPSRFHKAPLSEKRNIYHEAMNAITLYSFLVYKYYPDVPEFRGQINSSQEMKKNFDLVKNWLEKNNGKQIAEHFANVVYQAILGSQQEVSL